MCLQTTRDAAKGQQAAAQQAAEATAAAAAEGDKPVQQSHDAAQAALQAQEEEAYTQLEQSMGARLGLAGSPEPVPAGG